MYGLASLWTYQYTFLDWETRFRSYSHKFPRYYELQSTFKLTGESLRDGPV